MKNKWLNTCGIKGIFLNKTLDGFDKTQQPKGL